MTETRKAALTRWLEFLATVLVIVVTLTVGSLVLWDRLNPPSTRRSAPPLPSEWVGIEGAAIRGDRAADVAVILFSEFQCPFCGTSARDVLPEIDRQYFDTGKAFLAFRHYPLAIHANAQKAAEAAECAGNQMKFWEFHDWAFQHQKELDLKNLALAAESLGLDAAQFATCLGADAAGEMTKRVEMDVTSAEAFGVAGTPAWFLGVVQGDGRVKVTERLQGAVPVIELQKAIDRTIEAARAQVRGGS